MDIDIWWFKEPILREQEPKNYENQELKDRITPQVNFFQ